MITVQATFSEAVTIASSNRPSIPLTIGSTTRSATAAAAATASTTHNFTYTVVANETDDDGIQVLTAATLANPGAIADVAGNAVTGTALPDNLNSAQSSHKVDTTRPVVSSLAYTSSGPYGTGDVITLEVTFNEPVTIGPNRGDNRTPGIFLRVGLNWRYLRSGSNTPLSATQYFRYTVRGGENDSNGVEMPANNNHRIFPEGDTIADAAGNAYNRDLDRLPFTLSSNQSGHKVDTAAPTVSGLAFTSSGPYGVNDVITLQATFSEAVTISSGTAVSIPLTIGSNSRNATAAAAATASTTHNFRYTTVAADADANGISVATAAVSSNPGRVVDTAGNAMTSTALPDSLNSAQSSHTVDGSQSLLPSITELAFTSSGPYRAGDVIRLQARFSKKVTVATGTAASIPLTVGSTTRNATAAVTATASVTQNFTYTVIAADADTNGISVATAAVVANPGRIIDESSNAMTDTALPNTLNAAQSGHKVDNVAPTVASIAFTSTGPYMAGDVITLRVSFSEAVTLARDGNANPSQIVLVIGSKNTTLNGVENATLSTTQNFTYTVGASDSDTDGISLVNRFNRLYLNDDTIADAAGNTYVQSDLPSTLGTAQSSHNVDTTRPSLTAISLTSTGPYSAGSIIIVQATFSEAVIIASNNRPSIPLTVGSTTRNATAAATNTASTRHNFRYTVGANETDSDGIAVLTAATLVNPNSITDAAGNALTGAALPDNLNSAQSSHTVDGSRSLLPTVTGLAFTSSGPYGVGDVIRLQVTFSKPVTFGPNEGHANPMQIGFSIGSNGRAFDGVENATLSRRQNFTYTVVANDSDGDGISVWSGNNNRLWLNGDTIADADGNAYVQARLPETLSSNQSAHKVDTAAPTINSLAFTSSGPYGVNDVITLRATFNEAVTISSGTAASIPLTIGSTSRAATAAVNSTASTTQNFTYTVVAADADTDGISVASAAVASNPRQSGRCPR